MSSKGLENFFDPESIALVGATDRKESIVSILTDNLIKGYKGKVYPVNPNRNKVGGIETFSSIKKIPEEVDLACIATPARTVPRIVHECGKKEIPAIIIISSGFREIGAKGKELETSIKREMKKYGMRILGPNSLGIIRPYSNLNVTISDKTPDPGRIAFFSQSGALGPTIIDRQKGAGMGFSAFVSVGNMIDVDFGDLIDYFGKDHRTDKILMHIESMDRPENFMSSARSFSRTGPIILEKSGKYDSSSEAIASHIGSKPGKDSLYDALFNRTGVVRVDNISDLFCCSEALGHECLPKGPNLAVITNAGGLGVMAIDALSERGGNLATFSDETKNKLKKTLSEYSSKSNPIDISSDGSIEDYIVCSEACLSDDNVDGVLVIYTPQGVLSPNNLAEELVDLSGKREKPIIACLTGGETTERSRDILRRGRVPTVNVPQKGVRVFMYTYQHLKNMELLYETPEPLSLHKVPPEEQSTQRKYLRSLIKNLSVEGRKVLLEDESKKFLRTYGISAVETYVASEPDKAVDLAEKIGYPVILKPRSPDLDYKRIKETTSIDLRSEDEIRKTFDKIIENVESESGSRENYGVTVQRMIKNVKYEIMLGAKKHPNFGSYIVFGREGIDRKLYRDVSVDFPPLDQVHASRLMERTKVVDLIKELDDAPEEKIRKLQEYLARLSQLTIDVPEIEDMRITLGGWKGGLSTLDARIKLDMKSISEEKDPHDHLIIKPYPLKYIKEENLKSGRKVRIRPIRPEDESLIFELFDNFSKETMRKRFFSHKRDIGHGEIVRFTSVDYKRTIRLVGELNESGKSKIIGMGSVSIDSEGDSGEFAIVVGDPWQGIGLGTIIMNSLIEIAKDKDLDSLWGVMGRENFGMIHLCEKLGFHIGEIHSDCIKMTLHLDS